MDGVAELLIGWPSAEVYPYAKVGNVVKGRLQYQESRLYQAAQALLETHKIVDSKSVVDASALVGLESVVRDWKGVQLEETAPEMIDKLTNLSAASQLKLAETNIEAQNLLRLSAEEIRRLRHANQLLEAKVEVMDLFACVLHTRPAVALNSMTEDVTQRIEKFLAKLAAEPDLKEPPNA